MMLWTAPHAAAVEWRVCLGHVNEEPSEMTVTTIGLDIAKNVFQVHGVDADSEVVLRRQLRRSQGFRCKVFRGASPL